MGLFAVVENGIITNLIVADSKEVAELVSGHSCVEYAEGTHVDLGWEVIDGSIIDPNPEEINYYPEES